MSYATLPFMSDKLSRITSHFQSVDPVIHTELTTMDLQVLVSPQTSDHFFRKLCQEIIGQQLAGKAADAIIARFIGLFPKGEITPAHVQAITETDIRNIGASWAKARYIKDLGSKVSSGAVRLDHLARLSDSEVTAELTRVKGIGPWTAEMFLIFTLGREDVFSSGDLGLKNGFKKLYGITDKQLASKLKKIVPAWSPYRSYASLALWHSLDKTSPVSKDLFPQVS